MPNVKISAATDAGTLLSSDMLPLARSGDTNAYHATMSEVAAFANTALASGAYGNVGRNLLHNGLFNVAQRGNGPWTASGAYTADRWQIEAVLDTTSFTVVASSDAQRAQIGDEAALLFLSNAFTGNAGATAQSYIMQKIEAVRRLSNKTVTISFWAFASSSSLKLGINLSQFFGTGGSPSAGVWAAAVGQAVTLGTTWTRYSVTLTLPSASGKTLGNNDDDYTGLAFFYSSGATNNATAGNIGVQSGTIQIWGVQLEVGSVATPLEKPDPWIDIANCQRFYLAITNPNILVGGYGLAAGSVFAMYSYPVQMRGQPVPTLSSVTGSNATSLTAFAVSQFNVQLQMVVSAAGGAYATAAITLDADL
jgi:hypothetical protein